MLEPKSTREILSQGPSTRDEWNSRREAGEPTPVRGLQLPHACLSGYNLSDLDLRGAKLDGSELSQTRFASSNLRGGHLRGCDLSRARLKRADLTNTLLHRSRLSEANLTDAIAVGATFDGAWMRRTVARGIDLTDAKLRDVVLRDAQLAGAILRGADLSGSNLSGADLTGADLQGANLRACRLEDTILKGANLEGTNLDRAALDGTDLTEARIVDCSINGCAAWNLTLDGTTQRGLKVKCGTDDITVDSLELGQFIHVLTDKERIGLALDHLTAKVVLVLGRFTTERKPALDAVHDALRDRDYASVVFDFEQQEHRDVIETVITLASLSRFIVADLTDARVVLDELGRAVPFLLSVPVVLLLEQGAAAPANVANYVRYPSVLDPREYSDLEDLVNRLDSLVIGPAETLLREIAPRP